jgi:hypothetical protein
VRRRGPTAAADGAPQPQAPHQALNGEPYSVHVIAPRLPPDFPRPVVLVVLVPHALTLCAPRLIALRPCGAPSGIALLAAILSGFSCPENASRSNVSHQDE